MPRRLVKMVAPSTRAGRWAGRLLAGAAVLFAAFSALVAAGQRGGETFFSNPALSATILPAAGAAIAAGVAGVRALVAGDRSVVVLVAAGVGAFVALFVIAELAFPH